MFAPSGQWVRTRTEADTKAFLKEKEMERERSMEPGKGTAIVTGIVVLFLLGWAVYALVR
ncbi:MULTISPECIES: hypothetical protein [unclassified Streptomyces]|uniref:hypothetical protein n=1 Tax=unclassified Streptomyces TaxID=2593676 RepID=UPI00278BD4EC|nr:MULTISPECIES: hypothetical protein [unclassified Streptomyces]